MNEIKEEHLGIIEEELAIENKEQMPKFILNLIIKKTNPLTKRIILGLDFTFNNLKNVLRVNWQSKAPWYREITDGMCWLGYCKNKKCKAFKSLFVINRGYGVFQLKRELRILCCPVCELKNYELRNVGFVNCEWNLKG